jgi:hypothetical protein
MTFSTPSRFFTSPEIINTTGKYLTRGGEVIEISSRCKGGHFEWAGTFPNGITDSWHRGGFFAIRSESNHDIVKKL